MDGTFWISEKQLDSMQASAVRDKPEGASFLVRGPAGSGKTNILLLRARWFQLKAIADFQIVVFTSSLKNFAQAGCQKYGLPEERVVTSMSLFRRLLEEYGEDFESQGSFEADREQLAGKVQALVDTHNIADIYDALLVDECQDYMDTELIVLRKLCKRLILAADSRQSIYRTTHSPGLLEKLVNKNVVDLKYHYRSGLELCTVADAILKDSGTYPPMRGECKYDESSKPSRVELIPCQSLEVQMDKILEALPGQLDLYPEELIGVLFPKKEQEASFQAKFDLFSTTMDKVRVRIDTMHGAKGLEFRAVHLAGCEALYRMGATQKRLVYTAILRGRTSAKIYFTGSIPGYLESAIAKLSPPKPDPKLDSLFGP
jgi:superfamily I DNA and RNA helicase